MDYYVPVFSTSLWLALAGFFIALGYRKSTKMWQGRICQMKVWKHCENPNCQSYHDSFLTTRKRCLSCPHALVVIPSQSPVCSESDVADRYLSLMRNIGAPIDRPTALVLIDLENQLGVR